MDYQTLPDENGCIIEDGILKEVKKIYLHTKPARYADIIITEGVKVIPSNVTLTGCAWVKSSRNIHLPESLERFECSPSDFDKTKSTSTTRDTKINLPFRYLQTSSPLPANTLFFLRNFWSEATNLKDYAALYLFQNSKFLVSYCRMKLTAEPDQAVKYFIELLQNEGKAAHFQKAANFVLFYKSVVTDATRTQLKDLAKEKKAKKAVEILEELELSISEPIDSNVPFQYFWLDCTGRRIYKYYGETFLAFLDKDLTLCARNLNTNEELNSLPFFIDSANPANGKWPYYHFETTKKQVADYIQKESTSFSDIFHSEKCWKNPQDWIDDVIEQPICNILAKHIVWIQEDTTFTLSPNQTCFLDSDGKNYDLRKNLPVGIAAAKDVDADTITAWGNYFTDYDLEPLFKQF